MKLRTFRLLVVASSSNILLQIGEASYHSEYEHNIEHTRGPPIEARDLDLPGSSTNSSPSFPDAFTISDGGEHKCALEHAGGRVKCWGNGFEGQLGDGRSTTSHSPVNVKGLEPAIAVSAGGLHSCAVEVGGTVKCWGKGEDGQLGHGGLSRRADPRAVPFLEPAVNVSCGGSHTCVLERSGSVKCWGWGEFGQLGHGKVLDSRYPVLVQGLAKVISLSAGALHTCVVELTGEVKCWGWGELGQLGDDNSTGAIESSPVSVPGIQDAIEVVCGYKHSCALVGNSTGSLSAKCWGEGLDKQVQVHDEVWAKTVRRVMRLNEILAINGSQPTSPMRSIW
eukprot:TRINITY_DN50684_c0_g1_i1.p1 TRINITY_DN50684_c0_g1~~TRINITY_DN50684_c0_g1_i1.p1  ORF type:complete len:337 (+),score=48.95 TRINITY_DN50684_c0_g1_i1:97-1107(+)